MISKNSKKPFKRRKDRTNKKKLYTTVDNTMLEKKSYDAYVMYLTNIIKKKKVEKKEKKKKKVLSQKKRDGVSVLRE